MCRITGIINLNKNRNSECEEIILNMRDSMAHGGPDDAGIYVNKEDGIALGHRRLSIIDLSSLGHQPMGSEDRDIWIIYNGEVYNFLELRQELKNSGYNFNSTSDTEVILKAYQKWGEGAFEKLNGMFTFCIYDKRKNLLYLVRDHAGIKPLYYSFLNGHFIFSSEVKTFKVFNRDWNENPDWRTYYLIFGYIPEPFTTLKGVFILPKGSYLKLNINTKDYEINQFAKIDFTEKIKDEREAIDLIRDNFTKVVERHLISNAPIGVFLSGGLDSSLIGLVASRFKGENLRTLSIVFNEKAYSEERYQRIIVDKINSKHRSYLVTEKDFIENLDDIFQAMDQPTIDGVNTYFISKCAKEEGLKSVLSGLGGDELFGGYPSFKRVDKVWFLRDLNFVRKFFELCELIPNERFKKLSFLSIDNPISYYLLFRGLFSIKDTAQILDIGVREVSDKLKNLYINKVTNSRGNFVSYLETDFYMKSCLLKDSDFMSMWHSVEVRVPFLDKEFMKLIFSIEEDIKFNCRLPKSLLLKAYKDFLPPEISSRKKMGFTFPFQEWLRNNINLLVDSISDNKLPIKQVINNFKNGQLHWSRFWSLVVLNNFYK